MAVYKGNLQAVQLLLTRGQVNIDSQGDTGNTFLIWAVYWNQPSKIQFHSYTKTKSNASLLIGIVAYLIESGAAINLSNKKGKSALQVAYDMGHTQLVRMLLAAGATINN